MINWQFDASKVEEISFETLKPSKYRIRVEEFETCKSKSGLDMIKFTFAVSGHSSKLWEYLVFNPAEPVITNTKIAQMSDSLGVKPGEFKRDFWLGKIGAVKTKIDDKGNAKISYFIAKCKQVDLPPWIEPSGRTIKPSATPNIYVDNLDDDNPF